MALYHVCELGIGKTFRSRMNIKGSRDIGDRFALYNKPPSQLLLL
jgi:hypothetical protein